MAYYLARVTALTSVRVQDCIDLCRTKYIQLEKKAGVESDILAHPRIVEHIDAWAGY